MKEKTIRTTLSLPAELIEATDLLVQQGKSKNRSKFIAEAIRKEIIAIKKAEIDAAFGNMAEDQEYQSEALQIESEFVSASWEALQLGETTIEAR